MLFFRGRDYWSGLELRVMQSESWDQLPESVRTNWEQQNPVILLDTELWQEYLESGQTVTPTVQAVGWLVTGFKYAVLPDGHCAKNDKSILHYVHHWLWITGDCVGTTVSLKGAWYCRITTVGRGTIVVHVELALQGSVGTGIGVSLSSSRTKSCKQTKHKSSFSLPSHGPRFKIRERLRCSEQSSRYSGRLVELEWYFAKVCVVQVVWHTPLNALPWSTKIHVYEHVFNQSIAKLAQHSGNVPKTNRCVQKVWYLHSIFWLAAQPVEISSVEKMWDQSFVQSVILSSLLCNLIWTNFTSSCSAAIVTLPDSVEDTEELSWTGIWGTRGAFPGSSFEWVDVGLGTRGTNIWKTLHLGMAQGHKDFSRGWKQNSSFK